MHQSKLRIMERKNKGETGIESDQGKVSAGAEETDGEKYSRSLRIRYS